MPEIHDIGPAKDFILALTAATARLNSLARGAPVEKLEEAHAEFNAAISACQAGRAAVRARIAEIRLGERVAAGAERRRA